MIRAIKALISREKKFLLIKRSERSEFFPSVWDFPGGKVSGEESEEKCLKREVFEEIGLNISVGNKLEEFDYSKYGVEIHFTVFSVSEFSGEIKLSSDHTEYKWFTREEMKDLNLAPVLELYFGIDN